MLPQLDDMTRRVLDRVSSSGRSDPLGALFLIRRYRATGRDDLCAVLEPALGAALTAYGDSERTLERASWLHVFAEGATVSTDARLVEAAHQLVTSLSGEWPTAAFVDEAAASIDACLAASALFDPADVVPGAIDALEHVVTHAYRPGDGVSHRIHRGADGRGDLADHARLASALLTAFGLTARLPYSMLAEELMQTSRDALASAGVAPRCEAARVLCRLAALHDDAGYRAAAVIADVDYRVDAEAVLARLARTIDEEPADMALYGLALDEFFAAQSPP